MSESHAKQSKILFIHTKPSSFFESKLRILADTDDDDETEQELFRERKREKGDRREKVPERDIEKEIVCGTG